MQPMRLPALTLALAALAHPALAHVGAVVSKATFCSPPPPAQSALDSGVIYSYLPEDADASYRIAWQDGDTDPTGKFTFYYLDHEPPTAVDANAIETLATPVRTVDGRDAASVYVSCACVAVDAGADICDAGTAPNCADGGARWCDNFVDWDTSTILDGVYWIAAVNNDPPYHVYNMSQSPVRVSHGAHKPPVVIVLKPDGLGPGADTSYRASVLVSGEGQLTLDFDWGIDEKNQVNGPVHAIARGVPVVVGSDGAVAYSWDVSALPNEVYFLSATVKDDAGGVSFSDSRYGLSVFHRVGTDAGDAGPGDASAAVAPDLASPPTNPKSPSGCACSVGGADSSPLPWLPFAIAAGALAIRRRTALTRSRIGCTRSRSEGAPTRPARCAVCR
jgi:MYXO-CTERM domain-containing protein